MAYATVAELVEYMGSLPTDVSHAEATRLLNYASEDINVATMAAWYSTDDNGNPTDVAIIEAFKTAACAHVAYMIETGDTQGVGLRYNSVSIGDVSLSGGRNSSGGTSSRGVSLAPRAFSALMVAGVLPAFTWATG